MCFSIFCTTFLEYIRRRNTDKLKGRSIYTVIGNPLVFLGGSAVKNLPAIHTNAGGAVGSIPGPGRSPGGGHGNPLQDCCLENPMDRGARWATVHGAAQSQTRLT